MYFQKEQDVEKPDQAVARPGAAEPLCRPVLLQAPGVEQAVLGGMETEIEEVFLPGQYGKGEVPFPRLFPLVEDLLPGKPVEIGAIHQTPVQLDGQAVLFRRPEGVVKMNPPQKKPRESRRLSFVSRVGQGGDRPFPPAERDQNVDIAHRAERLLLVEGEGKARALQHREVDPRAAQGPGGVGRRLTEIETDKGAPAENRLESGEDPPAPGEGNPPRCDTLRHQRGDAVEGSGVAQNIRIDTGLRREGVRPFFPAGPLLKTPQEELVFIVLFLFGNPSVGGKEQGQEEHLDGQQQQCPDRRGSFPPPDSSVGTLSQHPSEGFEEICLQPRKSGESTDGERVGVGGQEAPAVLPEKPYRPAFAVLRRHPGGKELVVPFLPHHGSAIIGPDVENAVKVELPPDPEGRYLPGPHRPGGKSVDADGRVRPYEGQHAGPRRLHQPGVIVPSHGLFRRKAARDRPPGLRSSRGKACRRRRP